MTVLFSYIAGIFAAAALLAPMPAAAVGFLSVGGTVVSENICANGWIQVLIKPAGILPPPFAYMWVPPPYPPTLTFRGPLPTPATPPQIGDSILAVAAPVLVTCVGLGTHPPIFPGYVMTWEAKSIGLQDLFGL